jgi:hypothetical protein
MRQRGFFTRVRKPAKPPFRVFFATDVHGSDRCFRKFLAAATAYEADALILGGDVAGKALVPILAEGKGRYTYSFQGASGTIGADELGAIKQRMSFNGFYPRITDASEVQQMGEDPQYVAQLRRGRPPPRRLAAARRLSGPDCGFRAPGSGGCTDGMCALRAYGHFTERRRSTVLAAARCEPERRRE